MAVVCPIVCKKDLLYILYAGYANCVLCTKQWGYTGMVNKK